MQKKYAIRFEVGIGRFFKHITKEVKITSLWFYVYDEDVPFARAYSPSIKSKDNVPQGKSSLQFGIYYIKQNSLKYSDEEVKSKVINSITE